MSSTIPNEKELNDYRAALKSHKEQSDDDSKSLINKENFINTPAWFDANEKNIDRPNSHPYPRVANLKSIIFDTIKEDNLLDIDEYASLIALKLPERKITYYGDVCKAS